MGKDFLLFILIPFSSKLPCKIVTLGVAFAYFMYVLQFFLTHAQRDLTILGMEGELWETWLLYACMLEVDRWVRKEKSSVRCNIIENDMIAFKYNTKSLVVSCSIFIVIWISGHNIAAKRLLTLWGSGIAIVLKAWVEIETKRYRTCDWIVSAYISVFS